MIKLYNNSLELVSILNNAYNISFEKRLNEIWQASFSMPADDPKVVDCTPYSLIEIFDGEERVDLFRIIPSKQGKDESKNIITFQCEHVLSTLLDDVMFQLNESGSVTDDTADVLNFILGKQSVGNWVLGTCGFTRNFEYKWENENLLNALFSVPKPFNADYQWTWDTVTYPWTLNLVVPSSSIDARILYKKNLVGIEKQVDPTNLITRIYGLGYGEGINQLTIKSINANIPYIDSSTIGTYGVISRIFADKRYESPETLLGAMQTILEQNKTPKITYMVKAADIYQITQESLDKFVLGNLIQVDDSETGFSFSARVVSLSKSDIVSNPGDVELEISNKVEDINNTINNLEVKSSVNEMYSQGATNIDSHDFQDNCDSTHGALIKFYLSDEVVRLNKCMLNYDVAAFRAYGAAVKGGGGSTLTSASGGGSSITSASGGSSTETSSSEGGHTHIMEGIQQNDNTGVGGDPEHTHPYIFYAFQTYSNGEHTHGVTIPNHTHGVTIPDHTHGVTIPDHTHDIDHGIYEFGYLPPSVVVKVDGTTVTGVTALAGSDINIIPYLTKTGTKVDRGQFHTVEVIPVADTNNPKGLARIFANVVSQCFIKSVGGGDY